MRALRWASALALVAGLAMLLAAAPTATQSQQIATIKPLSYTSNGDLVNGWHWLRSNAQTSEWMFDVSGMQNAKSGTTYLNFTALVTKGVNGGSGQSGSLKVLFVGAKSVTSSVGLVNPFRPKDWSFRPTGYTQGIGYVAHGYVTIPRSVFLNATRMKVIVSRSNSSARLDLHIATNADTPLAAWIGPSAAPKKT
jgi:hypothetical protein